MPRASGFPHKECLQCGHFVTRHTPQCWACGYVFAAVAADQAVAPVDETTRTLSFGFSRPPEGAATASKTWRAVPHHSAARTSDKPDP